MSSEKWYRADRPCQMDEHRVTTPPAVLPGGARRRDGKPAAHTDAVHGGSQKHDSQQPEGGSVQGPSAHVDDDASAQWGGTQL